MLTFSEQLAFTWSTKQGCTRCSSMIASAPTQRIEALTRDFAGILDAASDVATDDEHDPEGATIAFERAQVTALRDHAHAHLVDVLHALRRLGDGTYDTCECCHRPIARVRLEARPVARTCISCAARQR